MKKLDWMIAGILGCFALILYFATTVSYAYPGESAQLMVLWQGLDASTFEMYPLAKSFAGLFGYGNAIAPICGTLSVVLLYFLLTVGLQACIAGEGYLSARTPAVRVGATIAAVVFMFTPAVWSAATHLEPRLIDLTWALLSFALFVPYLKAPKALAWLFPVVISVMAGLGLADTPMFLFLVPIYFAITWFCAKKRGGLGYGMAAVTLLIFISTFIIYGASADGTFKQLIHFLVNLTRQYYEPRGWLLVFLLATLPFIMLLLSVRQSLSNRGTWMQWCYHLTLSFVAILAIATPLSPSAVMQSFAIFPVAASACVAVVLGAVFVYWYLQITAKWGANESVETDLTHLIGQRLAFVASGVLGIVIVFSIFLNIFSFDRNQGRFADQVAEKILQDMGTRTWFVTDGTLDDHLRLAAQRTGKELNLICLQRDYNEAYLDSLEELVKAKGLGGDRNEDLVISLSLGVLAFVQDWFAIDPAIAEQVVVFGAPDLWYAADKKPVPELFFFGADATRTPDWGLWEKKFNEILHAPKGWGSYKLSVNTTDPLDYLRLNLRRHVGMIANNQGVALQDEKQDDAAFARYEMVLNEIDADNVCALFNEFELVCAGHKKALAKKNEITRLLNTIKDDPNRRYRLWALANYYGYIRSPEVFLRQGYAWARSGRPGEALRQMHRAIDFIPTDKRTALVNMMAALYASEQDVARSRAMYESVLASDTANHDALIGLMRLELLDGNEEKALDYLAQATASVGDDPRFLIEVALLHLMRGELAEAGTVLRKETDAHRDNLQAWSLLAAVTIQQIDNAKDEAEKAKLMKYLEEVILATMENQSRSATDYYLQTTRAFVLLRKKDDRRREARDALIAAAQTRPDIGATADLILSLDISLNDTVDAERQAREVLRRNRQAPLANYVMGSLALQNARYAEAENFLRRAADAPKPVVLALNDLAEVLRRKKNYKEAEFYARRAVETDPKLYVAWETLGAILLDAQGDLAEAEAAILKACELSKDKDGREGDIRMLISLARVQIARKELSRAGVTIRKVNARIDELSEFERREFEELKKNVR